MSDKSDYLKLCDKVSAYDSSAALWMREEAPKRDDFRYDGNLSACFVWDNTPQGQFFWDAMNGAFYEALRTRTGSANRRVDPDTMEEFFTGWGMDGNIMEPEKLPPMSGPVTMADGTVLVPHDPVCHPSHYAANGPTCPHCGSNIECITITERMGFCLGNTVKYIWRKDAKGKALEDLKKARWYLDREIERMEAE